MESKKERVLAYSKAKLIKMDNLSNVSGGSVSKIHSTFMPSAANQHNVDVAIDTNYGN